jgi:hypothetical protein
LRHHGWRNRLRFRLRLAGGAGFPALATSRQGQHGQNCQRARQVRGSGWLDGERKSVLHGNQAPRVRVMNMVENAVDV